MKQKLSFLLAVLLFLLSGLTAGCSIPGDSHQENRISSVPQSEDSGRQPEQAMGRYREDTISFPVSVRTIFDLEKKDGSIRILLEQEPGSFYCCKSQDEGVTWQQESWDAAWLPEHYRIVSACFAPEDTIFVSAGKMSEDPMDDQHATGIYDYFKLKETPEGLRAEPFSLELPEPKEEYKKTIYGLSTITCSEDGKLTGILQSDRGENLAFQIMGFDSDSGARNWKRDTAKAEIKTCKNTLYLNEYDGIIRTLNTADGTDLTETVSSTGKVFFHLMALEPEKKKFYYCDETGIYSSDDTMSLTELLVDGRLCSFSDISSTPRYFYQINENVFLIFLETPASGALQLLRYEYDATLSTQPEQELKIYSLYSDDIIKKLISDFHSSHPNVLVTYETGMEDSGAQSESDAIRILNTEIMAGKGPDLLFLNGLPWNSYAAQDILLDLNNLESLQNKDRLFQNLFSAFETEGRQYMAPIGFSIPVLVGEESRITQVDSMEDLLEMVRDTENLPPLEAGNFLPCIFSIFWQTIQKEDGSISGEEVQKLLQYTRELNDLLQPEEGDLLVPFQAVSSGSEGSSCYNSPESFVNVWNVVYGNTAASLGYLNNVRDFIAISDHIPGQNLDWRLFPEQVFTSLLAGINGKSRQPDLAGEFLEFVLSEEEQMVFIDGSLPAFSIFPVNRGAWQAMTVEQDSEKMEQYKNVFQRVGGSFHWPSQTEFDRLEQKVSQLNTPAMEDTQILTTITEKGSAYLSGSKSLDETVNEIVQTLELYLAESDIPR